MTRERSGKPRRSLGTEDPAFYEALGWAIKVARADRGLERKELAGLADVSYPYLSDIESGRGRPSSNALLALANALQMPLHELLRSAERYQARIQEGEAAYPRKPSAPAAPARSGERPSWFRDVKAAESHTAHALMAAAPQAEPAAGVGFAAPTADVGERPVPPSWAELRDLLERLRPEDADLVVELARRLALEHPPR